MLRKNATLHIQMQQSPSPTRPPSIQLTNTDTVSENNFKDLPSPKVKHFLDEVQKIREDLEKLVGQESVVKEMALEIMKLHHKMENCITRMQTSYIRESDRLHHALEQVNLKWEVDGLALRQKAKDEEILFLQSENEQLQTLASAPPAPSRGRR